MKMKRISTLIISSMKNPFVKGALHWASMEDSR